MSAAVPNAAALCMSPRRLNFSSIISILRSLSRVQFVRQPVGNVCDADREIVALTVLETALLKGKHLERLVRSANGGEQRACILHRNLRVSFAVRQKIGAPHLLSHTG